MTVQSALRDIPGVSALVFLSQGHSSQFRLAGAKINRNDVLHTQASLMYPQCPTGLAST
jgi:hypothetical protein